MSNNSQNHWLSNILRPRASSISVESCLNLSTSDPTTPLDARPILPLLDASQPLTSRCKHLVAFSEICKSYKLTHLENVFFTVQDVLDPTMPREARHVVFDFMLACIIGQYTDLGMARVTFYSSLRNYNNWEDFSDMYKVLFALCKEGRDISGFEKNICKLLIHWLDIAIIQQRPSDQPIPYLCDILDLLTLVAKFNFALFEEDEVTKMIDATHKAFFSSHHINDSIACLKFTDIVVRYRFVPFHALPHFLDILAASVILIPGNPDKPAPDTAWPIFSNLLRSHCAHSAILTLCKFLDKSPSNVDKDNILIKGAITLLGETAWGKNSNTGGADTYMVSDSVILMYLRRAATKGNDTINGTILNILILLIGDNKRHLSLMEWEAVWDIVDVCTSYILKITDNNSNNDVKLFDDVSQYPTTSCIYQFSRFSKLVMHQTKGPLVRWIGVLYQLRAYCNDETAKILLDYYVTEHSFLPSTENWLTLLKEITNTFYIYATNVTPTIRLSMLAIVYDVCNSVKDFYSEIMYETIVIPMMQTLPLETNLDIRQTAIDLLVSSLSDCQSESIFTRLVSVLRDCAQCQCTTVIIPTNNEDSNPSNARVTSMRMPIQSHRTSPSSSSSSIPTLATPTATSKSLNKTFITNSKESTGCCIGISAMCGITELFENLLLASNGKLCAKTFDIITEIANDEKDLACPYGGPKIVALDLLLRFRCPTNHHLYLIDDTIAEEDSVIASIRAHQQKRKEEYEKKRSSERFIPGPANTPTTKLGGKPIFHPSPHVFSYNEKTLDDTEVVLDINEMLKSYVGVLTNSPNWVVVSFVLKRLPQQLSNKHLFCGASPYINKLRRRLVKWTSTRKFLENVVNVPATTKRNDLNVYAYSLLTVLISYRRIFTEPKQDQDEIVYAFYVGIMQVTSATRLCINSLTVCCHELPLSVAKMLNEILQRMSQIISVSSVSVHILEFLSGLARLPNLYANFTGDMYKPVFAIALNYLQHSHSQQYQQQQQQQQQQSQQQHPQSQSQQQQQQLQQVSPLSTPGASPLITSPTSNKEVSQGALKQYVLIMAYLVITVWFTAIPLRERRKHVPFIIQRLLSGISMGKTIDEQTYTCIDMLSRFTFADVSLAPEKSIVSKILMGDGTLPEPKSPKQSQRTWVYGHTLLTLRTAKSLGWVEVMIRRPSGTVSMMCYVENKIKSEDIDYRTLPALLMMQYQPDLLASKYIHENNEPSSPEKKEEGLGIIYDQNASSSRRPSEQSIVSANVTSRSDGLVMTPSETPEQSSPRRPSLSQKGLIDLLNRDSETSIVTEEDSVTKKSPEANVRVVLSEPKTSTGEPTSSFSSNHHLRKIEPSIDPGFLYLQFNNYPDISAGRSMDLSPPLPDDEATARTLATFDRIPVVDFHKIGVLYVGKGQSHELEILANTYGSPDYVRFLNALGTIQRLRGRTGNSGGLDREMDIDGKYAYFWKDDVTEAVFHIATLMPTDLERDPQCSAKKRHIGNDYVSVVYNDSGMDYAFDTLPSQFNFINIVVSPHSISTEAVSPSHALIGAENTFFKVEMQRRPDMPDIGPMSEPKLVSAQSLPGFVRLAAIHANIFAQVFWQAGAGGKREYVSHWRERLKQIHRIKERLNGKQQQQQQQADTTKVGKDYEALLDFTKYT